MENRLEGVRAGLALITTGVLIVAFALYAAIPALATHVTPTHLDGNPNCEAVEGTTEILRLEDNDLANGTYPAGGGSVTVSNLTDMSFDWSSSGVVITAVFVKAGNGGWLYNYLPSGETSDTGLGSVDHAISHITFCSGGQTTTTTQATTTTTQGETTTTTGETTTTNGQTTTTTQATTTTTEGSTTTTEGSTTTTEGSTTTTERSTTTTDDDGNNRHRPTTTTTEPTTTTTQPTTTTTDEVLGTVITTTTVAEVVVSTLPFTGGENDHLAMLAMALMGGGILIVLGVRSLERSDTN